MSRRMKLVVWIVLMACILGGCAMVTVEEMYAPPKRSPEYQDLQRAIDSAMTDMEYASPLSGENRQTVQMADLNGDGIIDSTDATIIGDASIGIIIINQVTGRTA